MRGGKFPQDPSRPLLATHLRGKMTDFAFRVLGPLTVSRNGKEVVLRGTKQRSLLATLFLEANYMVPVDRLVGLLWEGEPPRSAVANPHLRVASACCDG